MSTVTAKALAQRKAKKQKQILAVASVVLLAVVGFQLTKVLGGGGGSSATPAVTTTALGLPSSPLAEAPGKLPDTDRIVIQHDSDQLLSFGLFKSKDPFVQQLSSSSAPLPSSSARTTPVQTIAAPRVPPPSKVGAGLTPANTTPKPASTVPSTSTTPATPATTTPSTTTPSVPANGPASVLISTNGVCQAVALKGTFPVNEDIFRVVEIAQDGKSIKIGVVGGSYDSGQPTATLKLGDKLTLVNTADGTRYVIALRAKCDVQTAPTSTTPTTPTTPTATTTTPYPSAPATTPGTTPTTTTPIVTDSLDTTTTTPFG